MKYVKSFLISDKPIKPIHPQDVIKNIERMIKEYNISPKNIIADRSTLNWLFLSK